MNSFGQAKLATKQRHQEYKDLSQRTPRGSDRSEYIDIKERRERRAFATAAGNKPLLLCELCVKFSPSQISKSPS